nr:14751_t:CDS:2 [Entrophospora candida]
MSQTIEDEQIPPQNFSEGSEINFTSPVILLIGKTGAGKSTLGNLLLDKPYDEGPFEVSSSMDSCTQKCGTSMLEIDGVAYKLVDTPGIFDTQRLTDEILMEIAKTIHKCAYGVKAILFVFEAKRFTEEQKSVLQNINLFLGEGAIDYIIAIFSHATKKQNASRDEMRNAWNPTVSSFIRRLDNRWGISPNPDYYPPDDLVHKARLGEIKAFISGTRGVYTTEEFESARRAQEEIQRIKKQEEEQAKRQYEENLKIKGKEEAEREYNKNMVEIYKKSLEEYKDAFKELKSQIDKLKGDCFALDTKVQLASGKVIEMAELQVGDLVFSNVRNNKPEFSEVYLISHLGHYDYPLKMIKIEFTNPDGSKGQIRMTSTHCIFRSDLSILYAQDVVPGETKILVLDKANELIPVTVDSLVIEQDTGYISFYTRAGTVIANNILCSCYDDCPPSQFLMDLAFAPIRLWTKVFPSTHRQKELHPYVQILETAYVTWCKALDISKRIKMT